jgi:hypothetical protein
VSSKSLLWIIALALLGFAGAASAEFSRSPTLLFGTPTSDVLPVGTLAISTDMSLPLRRMAASGGREENANVRFSPYNHLDLAVTAYTFADYVLDVKYQLMGGGPGRLGLAVGACDLGLNRFVSPLGHGTANVWLDWKYQANDVMVRPYENLSAFAVASYRATTSIRLHAGIGRGRFVGYGDKSKYLNTDILFHGHHQWAVGLFGGAEAFVIPQVAVVAEVSGRDVNAGVRANFSAFTATVAWTKMEGLLFSEAGEPRGRLEVSLSYRFHNWSGISGLLRPRRPAYDLIESALPPREESLTLQGATARPIKPRLEPILFNWDSWTITPTAAASLVRNAEILLGHPQGAIVVTGHASEEGSPEANCILSGKRALAVFEHLRALGVPQRQMRCRSKAEAAGSRLLLHRVVCFDAESGDWTQ